MNHHRYPSATRLAACGAALLATALPWQTALADTSLAAAAQVCHFDRYNTQVCTGDSRYGSSTPVSYQISEPGQQAYASMGYGVFKGSADASIASGSVLIRNAFTFQSTATGTSVDTWVISGGTGQGYLQFTWSIDGTPSSTSTSPNGGGTTSDAYLYIDAHATAQTFGSVNLSSDVTTGPIRGGSGTYQMSGPVAFTFDRPVEIVFSGFVVALLGADSSFSGPLYSGEAHADFSHTAILTGIQAYDSNGTLLSNITINAESGTKYPLSAVPEPTSLALMLAGLGTVAWQGRRQRHRMLG